MLFSPDLVECVRAETQQAITSNGLPDMEYLLNSCPVLNGIWEESLRVTAFGASVRFLTQDVEIGGKCLRKGNRIMMPQRQLHFDKRVFGEDTEVFKADRFVKSAKLKRNSSYRPFGGGATLCPGRHLAKQTSLAFVALLLHRFDIKLEPSSQPFPMPTEGNPSIGLVDVMQGSDLRVRLTPRSQDM
jgi:cytochrome P450